MGEEGKVVEERGILEEEVKGGPPGEEREGEGRRQPGEERQGEGRN